MKAIVLAAGEGKRFNHKHEDDKPKCMIEIGDTTLLNIQIDTLYKCGIKDIVIVRGYEKGQIDVPGIRYYDNDEYSQTNVLYSLFTASDELDDEVLILYSDIYFEDKIIKNILESTHAITIGCLINYDNIQKLKSDISLRDMELIDFESDNKIRKIGKNLDPVSDHARGQFIGIIKLSKKGCSQIKRFYDYFKLRFNGSETADYKNAWITDLFSEMVNLGIDITATITESGWFEINTFEDYQTLLKLQSLKEKYLVVTTDWTKRAEKYNQLEWVNNDRLLQHLAAEVPEINPDFNILDVGTGTGKVLIFIKIKKGDANFFGCDISQAMMDKINPDYGFDIRQADVTNLDTYPDNYFDIVTARMMFHHVDHLDQAMNEIRKKLKPGGKLIICEGNPPSYESCNFYTEMFFYKETRNVFMETDLINLFARNSYTNINTRTIILPGMSLNNWIDNSGLPQRNIDIIKKMHYNCADEVKKDYNMSFVGNDVTMDWKFSIVSGHK